MLLQITTGKTTIVRIRVRLMIVLLEQEFRVTVYFTYGHDQVVRVDYRSVESITSVWGGRIKVR